MLTAVSIALAACAPTFDWREVPVAGTDLVARFPCHPVHLARTVTVAGQPLAMTMTTCEEGGVTYGLSTAEVGDPVRVDAVLTAMASATWRGVGAPEPEEPAFEFPGVTPFRGNVRLRVQGRRPDGQAVEVASVLFARGTRVYQATALGASLPEKAVRPFRDGLHFREDTAGASGAPRD